MRKSSFALAIVFLIVSVWLRLALPMAWRSAFYGTLALHDGKFGWGNVSGLFGYFTLGIALAVLGVAILRRKPQSWSWTR